MSFPEYNGYIISKKDIASFYMISLCGKYWGAFRNTDRNKILVFMNYFGVKILCITKYAINRELRHLPDMTLACYPYDYLFTGDVWNLKDYKKWMSQCEKIHFTFVQSYYCFHSFIWESAYGGKMWGKIALAAQNIEKLFPVAWKTLGDFIVAIDHLIDLEHNSALYLGKYFEVEDYYSKFTREKHFKKTLNAKRKKNGHKWVMQNSAKIFYGLYEFYRKMHKDRMLPGAEKVK